MAENDIYQPKAPTLGKAFRGIEPPEPSRFGKELTFKGWRPYRYAGVYKVVSGADKIGGHTRKPLSKQLSLGFEDKPRWSYIRRTPSPFTTTLDPNTARPERQIQLLGDPIQPSLTAFIDDITPTPYMETIYQQVGARRLPNYGDKWTKHLKHAPKLKPLLRSNRSPVIGSDLIMYGFYLTDIQGDLKDLPALESLFNSDVFTQASDVGKLELLSQKYEEIREQAETLKAAKRWFRSVRQDTTDLGVAFPRRLEEVEELLRQLRKIDPALPAQVPAFVLRDPGKQFRYWLRTVESSLEKHTVARDILDTYSAMREVRMRNRDFLLDTLRERGWKYLSEAEERRIMDAFSDEDRPLIQEFFDSQRHRPLFDELWEQNVGETYRLAQSHEAHGLNLVRLARGYGDYLEREAGYEGISDAIERFRRAAELGHYTRLTGDRVPYQVLNVLKSNEGWTARVRPLALGSKDVRFTIDISNLSTQALKDFDPSGITDIRAQEILDVVESKARQGAVEILSKSTLGKHLLASRGVTQGKLVFSSDEFNQWFSRLLDELGTFDEKRWSKIGPEGVRVPIPQSVLDIIRSEAAWAFTDSSKDITEVITDIYMAMQKTIADYGTLDFSNVGDEVRTRLIANFLDVYFPERGGIERLRAQRARYLHALVKEVGVTNPDEALVLRLVNQVRAGMPADKWERTYLGRWLRSASEREILDTYRYLLLAPEHVESLEGQILDMASRQRAIRDRIMDMAAEEGQLLADDVSIDIDIETGEIREGLERYSRDLITTPITEAIADENSITILKSNKKRIRRSLTGEEIRELLEMRPELRDRLYAGRRRFRVRGAEPRTILDIMQMQEQFPSLEISAMANIDGKWQAVIPQRVGDRIVLTSKATGVSYYYDDRPQTITVPVESGRRTFALAGDEDLLDFPRAKKGYIPVHRSLSYRQRRAGAMGLNQYKISHGEILRTVRDDALAGKAMISFDIETTGFADDMMALAKRLYPGASPEELAELARGLFHPTEFAFQAVRYRNGIMEAIDAANAQAQRVLVRPTNQLWLAVEQITGKNWTLGTRWNDIDVGFLRNIAKYSPDVDYARLMAETDQALTSGYLDYLREHARKGLNVLHRQGMELREPIERIRGLMRRGASILLGHNIAGFDVPAFYEFQRRVGGGVLKPTGIVDTYLLSETLYRLERNRLQDVVYHALGQEAYEEFIKGAHLAGIDVEYTNRVAAQVIKQTAERGFEDLQYIRKDTPLLRIGASGEPGAIRGIYAVERFLYPSQMIDNDPNTIEDTYRLILRNTRTGATDVVSATTRYDLENKILSNFMVGGSAADLEDYERALSLDYTQRMVTKARTSAISMNYRMAHVEANVADAAYRSEELLRQANEHFRLGVDTALSGWQGQVREKLFPHTTYGKMYNEFQEYYATYRAQVEALVASGMSEEAAKRRVYDILTDRQKVFLQNRQMFTETARLAFINQQYMSPRTLQGYEDAALWLRSPFADLDRRFLNQLEDLRRVRAIDLAERAKLIGKYITSTGEILPVPTTPAPRSARIGRITFSNELATDINITYWNENQVHRSFRNVIEDIADKAGIDQSDPDWERKAIDEYLLPALRKEGLIGKEVKTLDSAIDIVYNTILDDPSRFPAAELQDYNRMVANFYAQTQDVQDAILSRYREVGESLIAERLALASSVQRADFEATRRIRQELGNLANYNAWPEATMGFNPLMRGLPEDAISVQRDMSSQAVLDALREQTRAIGELRARGRQFTFGSDEAKRIFEEELPPMYEKQRDLARVLLNRVASEDEAIAREAMSALGWNADDLGKAVIIAGEHRHIGRTFEEVYKIDPDFFKTYRGVGTAGGVEQAEAMLRHINNMAKAAGDLPVKQSPAEQLISGINAAAKQVPDTAAASPGMRQMLENAATGLGRTGRALGLAAGVLATGLLVKNLIDNDPFLESPRSSAMPQQTVYMQNEENEGMKIKIRGRVRGGSRQIADAVQRTVQSTVGQQMNVNLSVRDNLSDLNRQHVEGLLADLTRYGYIPRRR